MIRNFIALLFLTVLAGGGFLVWRTLHEHQQELAEKEREIESQRAAIGRLTKSRRVAQAVVAHRWTDEKTGKLWSKVRFVEVDEEGKPINTRQAELEGDVVHFDGLVLKFEPALVQAGDPVKGRSVLLFRRMYGENDRPSEGKPLDEFEDDGVPRAYRSRETASDAERALWERFWQLANNPELAKKEGVRIAQGEAVYTHMEEGMLYELTLDDAGGLNIKPTRIPAALMPEEH
jgi:hypothetical protein